MIFAVSKYIQLAMRKATHSYAPDKPGRQPAAPPKGVPSPDLPQPPGAPGPLPPDHPDLPAIPPEIDPDVPDKPGPPLNDPESPHG